MEAYILFLFLFPFLEQAEELVKLPVAELNAEANDYIEQANCNINLWKKAEIKQNKHLLELYDHDHGLFPSPALLEEELVKQAGFEAAELNVEEDYHNAAH